MIFQMQWPCSHCNLTVDNNRSYFKTRSAVIIKYSKYLMDYGMAPASIFKPVIACYCNQEPLEQFEMGIR